MTGRRIVSIWLPHLAIESWQSRAVRRGEPWPEDMPLALAAPGPHGPVIHALNRAAELAGARVGGRVTDIRAICPSLQVMDAEPAQDAARLAHGARGHRIARHFSQQFRGRGKGADLADAKIVGGLVHRDTPGWVPGWRQQKSRQWAGGFGGFVCAMLQITRTPRGASPWGER